MAEDPVGTADARERREWRALASLARMRGAAPVPLPLRATAATMRHELAERGLVVEDDWLVHRDDHRSQMSRLVRRQLAVAGWCSLEELADGVLRAQPYPELTAPELHEVLERWGPFQPTLSAQEGVLAAAPGQDTASWSTEADLVVVGVCDASGAGRSELLQALVDAGRTHGTAQQQLQYSPLLRPAGRRGRYLLIAKPAEPTASGG